MQENESENQGDDHTQLVDGHHLACLAQLQGTIIAQPGRTGCQTGKDKEQPAALADLRKTALGMGQEYHTPGHNHHHHCADSGGQIGIHTVNTYFSQNGSKRGKDRRTQSKKPPHDDSHLLVYVFRPDAAYFDSKPCQLAVCSPDPMFIAFIIDQRHQHLRFPVIRPFFTAVIILPDITDFQHCFFPCSGTKHLLHPGSSAAGDIARAWCREGDGIPGSCDCSQ